MIKAFEPYRASVITRQSENNFRASLPRDVIARFKLEELVAPQKDVYIESYKVERFPSFLILAPKEFTVAEIRTISKFFNTTPEKVRHFKDIRVYVSNSYSTLKFGPKTIKFLKLVHDTMLGFAPLEIEEGWEILVIQAHLTMSIGPPSD